MLSQWWQKYSLLQIIEPIAMVSKWCQKCNPLQIIQPLTQKTWDNIVLLPLSLLSLVFVL